MALDERIRDRLAQLVTQSFQQWRDDGEMIAWASNVFTITRQLLGSKSFQAHFIQENLVKLRQGHISPDEFIIYTKGILAALQSDFEGGFLADLRGELRAEVEGNLLAQAHRLLEEELKDPAAMLLGAILEDTLRHLCQKNDVPEGNSIEAMNVPLRNAGVYSLPQQQLIIAWAAIRNKADHAWFDDYSLDEVRVMHQGIASFIAKSLS